MPGTTTTESFANILGKHSGVRKLYIWLTNHLVLKNITIRREVIRWSLKRKGATHVLDAGFGFGQLMSMFINRHQCFNVMGIDKNSRLVADATAYFKEKNINNMYFRTADAQVFNQPEAFDLCLCINLLNYIEDDNKMLENMFESLRKPGMLFIFNSSNYMDERDKRLREGTHGDKFYREGYSVPDIKKKLMDAGFTRIKARYSYGKPGMWSWRLTTGWPTWMIKKSSAFYFILPLYVVICIPVILVLNYMDTHTQHSEGKCIVVKAFK